MLRSKKKGEAGKTNPLSAPQRTVPVAEGGFCMIFEVQFKCHLLFHGAGAKSSVPELLPCLITSSMVALMATSEDPRVGRVEESTPGLRGFGFQFHLCSSVVR